MADVTEKWFRFFSSSILHILAPHSFYLFLWSQFCRKMWNDFRRWTYESRRFDWKIYLSIFHMRLPWIWSPEETLSSNRLTCLEFCRVTEIISHTEIKFHQLFSFFPVWLRRCRRALEWILDAMTFIMNIFVRVHFTVAEDINNNSPKFAAAIRPCKYFGSCLLVLVSELMKTATHYSTFTHVQQCVTNTSV